MTFEQQLDTLAIEAETSSGLDRAGIKMSVPSWNLEAALERFCAVLKRPRFAVEALANAKTQLRALMPFRFDSPQTATQMEWSRLVFGEASPRTRDLTAASLEKIDRQDLLDFHQRHWPIERAVLAVAGDIDAETFPKLWNLHCSSPADPAATAPRPEVRQESTSTAPPGFYYLDRDLPQAVVLLGHRLPALPRKHADRAGLELLAEILGGGGAIARLAGRLRSAEGLAYQVTTSFDLTSTDVGSFSVLFEVPNASAARALDLVIEELDRLRKETVEETELRTARREVIETMRRAFDRSDLLAEHLALDVFLQRPNDWRANFVAELDRLRPTDVRQLAEKYLKPKALTFVVVGRWREIRRGARADRIDLDQHFDEVVPLPRRDPMTLKTEGDTISRP